MGYDVYLSKVLLPVAPSKITTTIKNQNQTMTLINEGEINLLKTPGLTDISFTMLIPHQQYPFARYINGFKPQDYYLEKLELMKTNMKPFQFIISRQTPDLKAMYNTNMTVTLEDYKIKEDRQNGFDLEVDIQLKQYRKYGTKVVVIDPPNETAPVLVNPDRLTVDDDAGSSGGGQAKKYKVQIAGMSVLEVWSYSAQGAITKACGSNYTGYVSVDGTNYYVSKGKISTDPKKLQNVVKKVVDTVKNVVNTVTSTVANIFNALSGAASNKTGRTTTTVPKPAGNGNSNNKVIKSLS